MATKTTHRPGDPVTYNEWGSAAVYGTSPDPILERAKAVNPPTPEELAADLAVGEAEKRFNDFLRTAARKMRDAGLPEGFVSGFGLMADHDRGEYENVRGDLERALTRRNGLRLERHRRIQAQVDSENANAAIAAQREYQRKRGIG